MFQHILVSIGKQSDVCAVIAVGFVLSLLVGMASVKWEPEIAARWIPDGNAQNEAIEKIFGGFRNSVREGQVGAITRCTLIIFAFNSLGSCFRTIACAFILPLMSLFFDGWYIGVSLTSLGGSSNLSVCLYLFLVGLEWISYLLSAAAGMSIGLSVLFPKRVECVLRGEAFKRAVRQAIDMYAIILAILAIQAVFEILYVRKILLMGGTGVPLAPW